MFEKNKIFNKFLIGMKAFLVTARVFVVGALVFMGWLAGIGICRAAVLSLETENLNVKAKDIIAVEVKVDNQEECLNAAQVVIRAGAGIKILGTSQSGSVLSLWPQAPTVNAEGTELSLAGGVPGGYCGRALGDQGAGNVLIKFFAQMLGPDTEPAVDVPTIANLAFDPEQTKVLLNDGEGTAAKLVLKTLNLRIGEASQVPANAWSEEIGADVIPPEAFSFEPMKDEKVFSGKYFIYFSTTDKQTGVAYYQVQEGNKDWVQTGSPYLLKNQKLNEIIRVRAVDWAGNYYMAEYKPPAAKGVLSKAGFFALAGGVLLMLLIMLSVRLIVKRKNKITRGAGKNSWRSRGGINNGGLNSLLLFLTLGFLWLIFEPVSALAAGASLYLSPGAASFSVGQTKNVSLILNSGGQAINSSQATVKFPTDKLEVTRVAKGGLFSFWPVEPGFSNGAGTVSFAGGLPDPGYSGSGATVLTITFRAKAEGTATVSVGGASILANDGKGTNVLGGVGGGTYTIGKAAAQPPAEEKPKEETKPQTAAEKAVIAVSSPTHPDFNAWYKSGDLEIIWSKPSGVTEFSFELSRSATTTPDATSEGSLTSKKYTQLESGVWYFHVRGFDGQNWGGTSRFKVQIDHDAPQDIKITSKDAPLTYRRDPEITLTAHDPDSGMDSYEVIVDKKSLGKISDGEELQYQLPELEYGKHAIKVIATDKVGNQGEGNLNIEVLRSQPVWGTGRFDLVSFLIGVVATMMVFGLGFLLGRQAKLARKRK